MTAACGWHLGGPALRRGTRRAPARRAGRTPRPGQMPWSPGCAAHAVSWARRVCSTVAPRCIRHPRGSRGPLSRGRCGHRAPAGCISARLCSGRRQGPLASWEPMRPVFRAGAWGQCPCSRSRRQASAASRPVHATWGARRADDDGGVGLRWPRFRAGRSMGQAGHPRDPLPDRGGHLGGVAGAAEVVQHGDRDRGEVSGEVAGLPGPRRVELAGDFAPRRRASSS